MAFTSDMRRWCDMSLKDTVTISQKNYPADNSHYICTVELEVKLLKPKIKPPQSKFDTEEMARSASGTFSGCPLTVGQSFTAEFSETKFVIKVTSRETGTPSVDGFVNKKKQSHGLLFQSSELHFQKAPDATGFNLTGAARGRGSRKAIISPEWNFSKMGIGGLDAQFQTMFRRAFASRVLPPDVVEKLGLRHCKGMLLYGPPGTGKTLIARKLAEMLNGAEPKVVNGPEIFSKFVGEAEKNIRELFEDAEKEEAEKGDDSRLHVIIFDEIDAVCKARGSVTSGTGVHDTVVNQLLTKIDGVDALNNILIIGMTNRKDMLDEAILRSGRLELHIQIGLPDKN
eukprot:UC4_evm1s1583